MQKSKDFSNWKNVLIFMEMLNFGGKILYYLDQISIFGLKLDFLGKSFFFRAKIQIHRWLYIM